ncbi:hypothetical protein G9A89_004519 [Geosiphon pyriformis]|nr:hypothetical protein G9A89_004519 [Geosiphon pyriformis]
MAVYTMTTKSGEWHLPKLKKINIHKRGARAMLRTAKHLTCDFIYNPPPYMIYTILEKEKPISSCTSELESTFNFDSNFDNNDDENNDSSSIQNGNKNNNDLDFDSNPKTYITLSDLTKEQELK